MKQVSRAKLKEMYYKLPNKEVCEKLGISQGTLVTILKENNIALKGASGRARKILVTD